MAQVLSRCTHGSRAVRRILAAGSLLLVVVLPSCGSDNDDSLTEQAFRDRSNEICAEGAQEIGEAVGAVFGESEPTAEQLQAALDTIVTTSRRVVDDIDALGAPHSIQGSVDAVLAEWRSANDVAEGQGLSFFDGEDDPWEKVDEMGRELGLDVCADS